MPEEAGADEAIQLDAIGPGQDAPGTKPPIVAPSLKTYNPIEDREKKRGQIAMRLVGLLIAVALAPFVIIFLRAICVATEASGGIAPESCTGFDGLDVMGVMQLVLTPVVALVGAATGFYFGEKAAGDQKG